MRIPRIPLLLATALVALPALAQSTGTQTLTASIKVIAPLVITGSANPNFGTISASLAQNGTVVLSTAGVPSIGSGTLNLVNDAANPPSAGSITFTSEPSFSVNVTQGNYAADTVTIGSVTLNGGGVGPNAAVTTGKLITTAGSGTTTLNIGATITVPLATATGTYHPTVDVTLTYD
jgi:hypothetical protein